MQPGRVVCPAVSCARPRRLYAPLSWVPHPKVARNLTRSFFDIAHKRCNSNDPISIFEIIARELRATLLRNQGTTTAGIWRMPGRVVCTLPLSWGTHPKIARNLTRSFFDIAHKRCNSNDSISMFEIIARELRATLLRNHGTTTAGIWRTPGRVVRTRPLSSATHPKVARNLTRSFFDIAHKRCNSNDLISIFEIIARELRATLLRNHSVEPQSRRAVEPQSRGAAAQRGCPPCSEHPR